jgi:DnaJ like chaperone protein
LGFWGKILGGVAGFALGGPAGALMGAALGHAADSGAAPGQSRISATTADIAGLIGGRESLFAVSIVVLSAKLAKVDGVVRREEIDAFKRLFHVPAENMAEVGRLFDRARDSADDYEAFAAKLGEAFADNKAMLEDVLHALVQIARADGAVNRAEGVFLRAVHARFGLDAAAWERARGAAPRLPGGVAEGDPYAVLGIPRNAGDEEVRAAWKNLMRENHPDSLASKGVPEEFIRRATDKVAQINAAWDRIKRERKL